MVDDRDGNDRFLLLRHERGKDQSALFASMGIEVTHEARATVGEVEIVGY
jgi:hypothetical protein